MTMMRMLGPGATPSTGTSSMRMEKTSLIESAAKSSAAMALSHRFITTLSCLSSRSAAASTGSICADCSPTLLCFSPHISATSVSIAAECTNVSKLTAAKSSHLHRTGQEQMRCEILREKSESGISKKGWPRNLKTKSRLEMPKLSSVKIKQQTRQHRPRQQTSLLPRTNPARKVSSSKVTRFRRRSGDESQTIIER